MSEPATGHVRLGIIGTGAILARFLPGAERSRSVEVVAIASRDGERARQFAADRGIRRGLPGPLGRAAGNGDDLDGGRQSGPGQEPIENVTGPDDPEANQAGHPPVPPPAAPAPTTRLSAARNRA